MKTQYYCYAIKITTSDSFRGVKIGECGDTDRVENLSRKYEEDKKNVKTKVIVSDIPLPCNNKKRLNDKTIHKRIISDGLFVKQDSSVLKEITGADDGKDEFFRLKDDVVMSDDEIAKYLRDTINDLGKDEKNFTANIEKPLRYRKNNEKKVQKHYVDEYYINIFSKYLGNIGKEKTFFLIGQFHEQFVSYIARNNTIYILYDSEDDKGKYIDVVKNNLYYFYDLDEVLKMCKKFDYIIANPPYAMGNELTKTIVENVEFGKYINLMPVSKYKGKELYRYVESIEKVEDHFDDACVGESLIVAEMSKTADTFSSFEELEMCKFDERFKKFYKKNSNMVSSFKYIYIYRQGCKTIKEVQEAISNINKDISFYMIYRTCKDGVHTNDDAIDRIYNLDKTSDNSTLSVIRQGNGYGTQGGFIFFNTPIEKDNFTDFWYRNGKNGLMHKLIKGLNKSSGTIELAIPRVDWSHPWTDEEILKEYGYTEEEIKEILE